MLDDTCDYSDNQKGTMMQKEFEKILNKMDVRENREDAEEMAIELTRKGNDALEYLIDLGIKLEAGILDQQTKKRLRAVIFTVLIFYMKNRSVVTKSPRYEKIVGLLIDLFFHGFQSARNLLAKMEYSDFDIYQKKLSELPVVEMHKHDKQISLSEAFEEIRMSKNYTGSKGFKKDRYALGCDEKREYSIYRVAKKSFVIRSQKK